MTDQQKSYLDENLTEKEKEGGRTRLPTPETQKEGSGKESKPQTLNPDRPDEFGDGDRRS
jgi:hypothetical protein